MAPNSATPKASEPSRRGKRAAANEESEDELRQEEATWEWIYDTTTAADAAIDEPQSDRKRRKVTGDKIVGARIGQFECKIGDTVLLKADGSNDAWVALIGEFIDEDDDGEMAANFMWFSTEKEIRNREKKRSDFLPVKTLENSVSKDHAWLTKLRRMSYTSPRHGTSTPSPRSTAKPRFTQSTFSNQNTHRAASLVCLRTMVEPLSAVEVATPVPPPIPTSSSGRSITAARMTSSI
jgi:hypothetical protein